jgi:ATP-dependent DNA helicase RecG
MNKQTLFNLITLGEGFTTEFKRTGTSSLGREICAFANATGGIILIGVAEPMIEVSENWLTTTFKRPNGQVEDQVMGEATGEVWPQPESQPESLEMRVLSLLSNGSMAKSALSTGLGQKEVSGQLNRVIRLLIANKTIEYTIPEKPNSRLQKYTLTKKGKEHMEKWRGNK